MTGRVPHVEPVFFLTMRTFGKVHPLHRDYRQWYQIDEKQRQLHQEDIADLYFRTAKRFEHSTIFLHFNLDPVPATSMELARLADLVRDKTGDR